MIIRNIKEPTPETSNISVGFLEIYGLETDLSPNKFFKIYNNPKFLRELPGHPHLDLIFGLGHDDISTHEIHKSLRHLFIEFATDFIPKFNMSLSCYWLDYGSLLGAYRENDIIEWDNDGDVGILDVCLNKLPLEYETKTILFKKNPMANKYVYDSHNTVSARFISKRNGVFLDLFAYSMVEDVNGFKYLYNSWSINDFTYWQRVSDLLPINSSGILFNHTFNIPHKAKTWLLNEYNTLEKPYTFEGTYTYNYDDNQYWQMYDESSPF